MATPARYYSSTAVTTTLSSSIGAGDTQITVASSSGFPSSYPFTLILEKDSANEEIVTVTGVVGSAFTVTRGVDGTSARTHSAGTSVEHGVSALDFTDFRSHQAAAANVHDIGASASVVGTDTTQTLTNKTLTSPTINGATVSGTVTGGTLSGQTITSGTLGSDLAAGSNKITGLADPSNAQDAATKNFVETGVTSQVVAATAQATAAASSASAAAASESAAATSESNAGTSETNAAASAVAAAASESAAATSESNAATSASNAASSASAASTSASNAAASESAAAASASAASTSASNASTSETNAAASAVSAANSAASAATALDNFDDRYLGQKSSDPSTDNDGDALITGALYFNTTDSEMKVYDGASWLTASAASVASIVTYEYTATASQTVFTGNDDNAVSMSFTSGLIQVFLNGVLLSPGDDYTTSTNTVTLASGAALNDVLVVVAFASFNVADTYTQAQADALFIEDPASKSADQVLSYDGSAWVAADAAAGATGAGGDKVFWENGQSVTTDYSITSGQNAGTFGPVSIDSGVTVTVPSNSVWTVV
jgi:hypothetical protein